MTPPEQDNKSRPTRKRSSTAAADVSAVVYGKRPPQAIPLEEAVLGALLIDKEALATVVDILKPESFYLDAHQLIYRAICRLFERAAPVDLLTVMEELRQQGDLEKAGGAFYLAELTNRVASSANVEYHARIISQKFILRELIRVSTDVIREAYDETTDVFDLLDEAERGLFGIAEQNMTRGSMSMGALIGRAVKQMEELSQKADGLTGVPSGFPALDRLTSGWQPSDLIIVAARPGMGKSAFTLALARNAAVDFDKPVAFFSLEMSNLQLVNRLIALETEIESEKLRKGRLSPDEWQRLHVHIERLAKVPIIFDDTPGISIFELRAKCRRLKMQHDIQLIIIDYLQLMTGGSEGKNANREQEISTISRSLKGLAKELNVPVIALAQLNRSVESRGGSKRPQLSDLRESGAIEQDADIVSFIYRPEYYGIMEDEEGNSVKGTGEIIFAKHRNGALDTVRLRWIAQFAKFANIEAVDNFSGDIFNDQVEILGSAHNNRIVSEGMDFGPLPFDGGDAPF